MASFAPEAIAYIGSFPITNTLLHTLIVDGLIVGGAVALNKNLSKIPSKFQAAIELLIETFYNLVESISPKNVKKIFPYVVTFFLFIIIANLTSLLPGFGSIGFWQQHGEEKSLIPLFRGTTSDINTTFALALISVFATHIMSIRTLGIKDYLSRYFSLNPINLFIGILEIISEITKVISLSFRLFGNIFAGEVVLGTVSKLFAFVFPLPFLMLETIVSFVQALVFAMLTMAFMAILTTPHHGDNH